MKTGIELIIENGIKNHALVYSFNIQSELFNQLTKEQQKLWRKEIEQACINGGNAGVELARDIRYDEPREEINLDKAAEEYAFTNCEDNDYHEDASKGVPFDPIGYTEKVFKAGAEWMSNQLR